MRPGNSLIGKFWRAVPVDRWLTLETTLWLAVARIMILLLPFRWIGRLVSPAVRLPEPPQDVREKTVRRIRWAIAACARRVPWRALCYEQSLSAQFMLRRRGIRSVLFYGAAPDDRRGLVAHVWVRCDALDVVGCDTASRFAVLAIFPEGDRKRRS